jgi:hypothetical protein
MSKDGEGWDSAQFFNTWRDFGPWQLDDLNEVVNFYFSVKRESEECFYCKGTGYSKEAKKIADDWYGFENPKNRWCDKITQDESDALWEEGRLGFHFKERPIAEDVNSWSLVGLGHDEINRSICVKKRVERLNLELTCQNCEGRGILYIEPEAHVSLTLWVLHPRKGCSRGIEVKRVEKSEINEIIKFLKKAERRNSKRFSNL